MGISRDAQQGCSRTEWTDYNKTCAKFREDLQSRNLNELWFPCCHRVLSTPLLSQRPSKSNLITHSSQLPRDTQPPLITQRFHTNRNSQRRQTHEIRNCHKANWSPITICFHS